MKGLSKYQYSLASDLSLGYHHDEPSALGKRIALSMVKKGFLVWSDKNTFGFELTDAGYGAITEYQEKRDY